MAEHKHYDIIGRPLHVGDVVAVSDMVCRVDKLHPKQIRVKSINNYRPSYYGEDTGYLKYGSQCALLPGPEVTAWLLKTQ